MGGRAMELIRIITPPRSLYVFGKIVAHDMMQRVELGRVSQGGEMFIPALEPIDLGIAWGRGSTPPVRLRFTAMPGRTYLLYWLKEDFGAGMGVEEISPSLHL